MIYADLPRLALVTAVVAIFVYIAIEDFQRMRIANRSLVGALLVYAAWSALTGFASVPSDLIVAGVLFAAGFVFWLLRLIGAGDAKLMFVCGAFAGMTHQLLFALVLIVATAALYVAMKIAQRPEVEALLVFARLKAFADLGKVPYGVPLSIAAIAAFLTRAL